MRKFLVVVVVLIVLALGGAVVADRLLHSRTETELADRLGQQEQLEGEPEVTIHGIPFLTQVLAEELDRVTLRTDGLHTEDFRLTDVHADARAVSTQSPYTAQRVTAEGTVPLDAVGDLVDDAGLGLDLEVSAEDSLLHLGAELLGAEVGLRVEPAAVEGGVQLQLRELVFAGRTVEPGDLGLEGIEAIDVPLTGLPDGVEVTGVEVSGTGVRVEVVGEDLPLEDLAG